MVRNRVWSTMGWGLALALLASPALAGQGGPDESGGASNGTAQAETGIVPDPGTPAPTQTGTTANLHASAQADARLQTILNRGRKVSAKTVESTDKKLAASTRKVDAQAASKGDATVAGRLATEFGTTADALDAERTQYQTGWGDLMIAHTLMANSKDGVTMDELFQMRSENVGWGRIASGLGLKLGSVVSATRAESRVALGLSKPSGKPARIVSASAHPKGGSHMGMEHDKAGSAASLGVGQSMSKGHPGR